MRPHEKVIFERKGDNKSQLLFGTRVVHLRSSAERRVSTLVTRTRNTDTATGVSNQPQYGFNVHDRRPSDSLLSRR